MSNQLLQTNSGKYVVFAKNTNQKVVDLCDRQESNIWLASDINLTHDSVDYQNKMSDDERLYLRQILGFFATSDGIVGENLAMNFLQEVQVPEVRYFYYFQCMMEAVHAKVYTQLITTFIPSQEERDNLFDSIETHPIIQKKANWAFKYMNKGNASFSKRLIAFLAIEGIFFAGSFAAIFWLRDRGILSNSLGVANEYISRDETMHAEFACTLYKEFCNDLTEEEIREVLLSALEIEKDFINHILPANFMGMSRDMMHQYLEYVTDTWLSELGCEIEFGVDQPFDFMATIGQKRKDNFFEKTRTNYARQTESKEMDWAAIEF